MNLNHAPSPPTLLPAPPAATVPSRPRLLENPTPDPPSRWPQGLAVVPVSATCGSGLSLQYWGAPGTLWAEGTAWDRQDRPRNKEPSCTEGNQRLPLLTLFLHKDEVS